MTAPSTPTSTMKPCPFCGEALKHHASRHGDDYYRHSRTAECPLNGGSLGDPIVVWDDPEAIDAWNRRSPVEAQPCAVAGEAVLIGEQFHPELRQRIGDTLTEKLNHMDDLCPDGVDWFDSRHVDEVIDAVQGCFAVWAEEHPAPSAVLPLKGEVPKRHPCAMCSGKGFYGIPGQRCEFCRGERSTPSGPYAKAAGEGRPTPAR